MQKENVEAVVLGESLDYKMKPNVIMEKIVPFKKNWKMPRICRFILNMNS